MKELSNPLVVRRWTGVIDISVCPDGRHRAQAVDSTGEIRSIVVTPLVYELIQGRMNGELNKVSGGWIRLTGVRFLLGLISPAQTRSGIASLDRTSAPGLMELSTIDLIPERYVMAGVVPIEMKEARDKGFAMEYDSEGDYFHVSSCCAGMTELDMVNLIKDIRAKDFSKERRHTFGSFRVTRESESEFVVKPLNLPDFKN